MARRKRVVVNALAPTGERMAGAMYRVVPTEIAGGHAYQMHDDCLVSALYEAGALMGHADGGSIAARRRLDAGMWLRTLYYERACMAPAVCGGYGARRGTGEISEATAWNQRVWNDTMRHLGPAAAATLRRHVIDDEPIGTREIGRLRQCLDLLADHRGI